MSKLTIQATVYVRPNGRPSTIEVPNVYPDDANWFKENSIQISMEELSPGNYAIYGNWGYVNPETEEPIEAIEVSLGRNCEETLKALRANIEKMKAEIPDGLD